MIITTETLDRNIPDRYRTEEKDEQLVGKQAQIFFQGNFTCVTIADSVGTVRSVGMTKRRPDDDKDHVRAVRIALVRAYNRRDWRWKR